MLHWTLEYRYCEKILTSFPLHIYTEVKLLKSMVVLFVIFWGSSILFSTVLHQFYILSNSAPKFPFLHIVTNTCYLSLSLSFFCNSHSNRCEVIFFTAVFWFFFFHGCTGSSLLVCGLPLVVARGGYSSLWCTGFLLWWLFLLGSMGSRHMGFSSCSMQAQ